MSTYYDNNFRHTGEYTFSGNTVFQKKTVK